MKTDGGRVGSWQEAERAVHEWLDGLMASYVQRARLRPPASLRPSVVNDGLWGSIRLNPLERALVDSPVVQRLRRIKQLGPALAVYPSARHTRFEHSLGALHRAATVMDALVASGSDAPPGSLLVDVGAISPWNKAVRVAALLHDVGHVFLSHAGERILTNHGCPGLGSNIPDLLSSFSAELDCEKRPGLAEFFSFAVMTSTQVAAICEHHGLSVAGTKLGSAGEVLRLLAGAIVHARSLVPERERWLCDVLSGPLDVDKQDYVPRDALMAGVGVQVEPHRCAEVLRVCSFEGARVLNESDPQITRGERRLTITFAGISVLEDLLLSRMSLFLRVYKHQKVRLIERLAERIFVLLRDLGELRLLVVGDGLPAVLAVADSVFYDGELLRRVRERCSDVARSISEHEAAQERRVDDELDGLRRSLSGLRVVEELARMLAERDFPVRAFAYGKMFPSADRVTTKQSMERADDAWAALMTDAINPGKRAALEAESLRSLFGSQIWAG
jgi:deoxynucleoside triphosphate triphosphohydrolase SAMHD1